MSRLPVAAFVALVVATVGAFFVTQHLKISTPVLTGAPAPVPSTINPVDGRVCFARNPQGVRVPINYKRMKVSFYLLNRPDYVNVYIVDADGEIIRTLPGSGRYLKIRKRRTFIWNGREDNGKVAPDGSYTIRVALVQQGRDLVISNNSGPEPVTVQTVPPDLRVTGVSPATLAIPGVSAVTIHYTGTQGQRPQVVIYRITASGKVRRRPVKTFAATTRAGTSVWNGTLEGGDPAPPGRYLIGLRVIDKTCNRVTYPASLSGPPAVGDVVTVG